MVGRNETEPWKEEKGCVTMQQFPCFFVTGIPFCLVFPCFATGCHTFGLKIATAAMRPRNDTNLERFSLENGRFSFLRLFLRSIAPQNLKLFVLETVLFSSKTYQICHCEEGAFFAPDAAI